MDKLVKHIVESIVSHPDEVKVSTRESVDFPGLVIIHIDANQEDLGIVIGKRGRTINAIRDLVTIAAIRQEKRVKVVVDEKKEPRDSSATTDKKVKEETEPVSTEAKTTTPTKPESTEAQDPIESVEDLDKELGL